MFVFILALAPQADLCIGHMLRTTSISSTISSKHESKLEIYAEVINANLPLLLSPGVTILKSISLLILSSMDGLK